MKPPLPAWLIWLLAYLVAGAAIIVPLTILALISWAVWRWLT